MEEVNAVVRAYQRRLEDADAHAAHYTAWLMQPHVKKAIKSDKMRRIKLRDAAEEQTVSNNVVSLEEKRKNRQKLAASLADRKDRIVMRR